MKIMNKLYDNPAFQLVEEVFEPRNDGLFPEWKEEITEFCREIKESVTMSLNLRREI